MRIVSKLALLAVLAMPFCPAAFAQKVTAPMAPPPCSGVIVTVRVSEITEGGSVEKFNAAVAAHLAWYRSHGVKNNQIIAAKVIERGPSGPVYSDKRFLTFHINPPMPQPPHDAGWDAFTKMYADTSKVVETYNTCMPETVFSADPVPWMKM
jgi:hypothetical protein